MLSLEIGPQVFFMRKARASLTALLVNGENSTNQVFNIANRIVDFYKDLFAASEVPHQFSEVFNLLNGSRRVTMDHQDGLVACLDEAEIRRAVFEMNPDSATGSDGYAGKISQFARTISAVIVEVVSYLFIHLCMSPSLNSSFVALLPKVDAPTSIVDYMPIVMSNYFFKIISKIIDSCLNEVVNFHSARLSILINGVPTGYFKCGRGVRQGDPISPILCGLVQEVLSLFSRAEKSGVFVPMHFCRGRLFPSHILYLDDILIFSIGTRRNVVALKDTMKKYIELSGQVCNPFKSKVY